VGWIGRVVLGLLLAAMGTLWTLQGFDLLGQEGGMNGRSEWIGIGLLAVVVGLWMIARGLRSRSMR
jgi:hypothetical protein